MSSSASDSSEKRWMRRVWPLLHWNFRFISERGELWGGIAVYILIVTGMSLAESRRPGIAPGATYLNRLQTVHWYLALGGAQSLAAASVLDRTSGILAFIRLTDLRAGQWIAYQLGSMIVSLIPAWLARIPFYTLAFYLGGASLGNIATVETLQGVGFLFVASLGLFLSRLSATNQTAGFATLVTAALFEGMFYLPELVVSIGRWWMLIPPGLVDSLDAFAFAARRLSLIHHAIERPYDVEEWCYAAAMIAVHLVAGGASLLLLRRMLFVGLNDDVGVAGGVAEIPKATRRRHKVRPRCWGDAPAWQAFHVYQRGPKSITLKLLSYSTCGVFTILALEANPPYALLLVVVSTAVAFIIALFTVSDCLAKEIKWQTFSTLALLPYDANELFRGWFRGVRWRILPDVVWIHFAMSATLVYGPFSAGTPPWLIPLWIGMMAAIVMAPPIVLMVSLQKVARFMELVRGILVLILLAGPFVGGVLTGAWVDPWAGLIVFVSVSAAIRVWTISEINSAFARRLETIS